ncbi:MAG TPA: hypothetical protein VII12_10525 [Thermoanaerobaculia bacterium]
MGFLAAIVQTLLTCAAGAGLFLLYRKLAGPDRTIGLLVATGLLLRAVTGQVLFWISFLRLPIGSRLQEGNGFWFFGLDSIAYFRTAVDAANHGAVGILSAANSGPSPFYVQVLAIAVLLFGTSAAIALLLNLAAYLGTCAIAVSVGGKPGPLLTMAVAAVSLSPSSVLWALQPLKEAVFMFLIAAFIGAASGWQSVARRKLELLPLFAFGILLAAAIYAIAGIRFYFAAVILLASLAFFAIATLASSAKTRVAVASAAAFVGCMFGFFAGSAPYRMAIKSMFQSRGATGSAPSQLLVYVERARAGFDSTGGASLIGVGRTLKSPATPRVVEREGADAVIILPTSRFVRLAAGAIAVTVPRAIAQRTGLLELRGGRGMWLFADLDTIAFDLVLAMSVFSVAFAMRRRLLMAPLFVLVLLTASVIGVLLVYTVSNFGTLFRHRTMISLMLSLLPVAIAAESANRREHKTAHHRGTESTEDTENLPIGDCGSSRGNLGA